MAVRCVGLRSRSRRSDDESWTRPPRSTNSRCDSRSRRVASLVERVGFLPDRPFEQKHLDRRAVGRAEQRDDHRNGRHRDRRGTSQHRKSGCGRTARSAVNRTTPSGDVASAVRRTMSEGHLHSQLHDALAGARQRSGEGRPRCERRAGNAVEGRVHAVDVVAVQQVERLPDQLNSRRAERISREMRGSSVTIEDNRNWFRVVPGAMSLRVLPSLFKSTAPTRGVLGGRTAP